ncbi:hypothetical protein ACFO5R_21690 [Halosolutus amylolyticus]|uniref:Uncharacterized protein n=1 Tax=Halosolutus amylolyticus TaxID=2932267 RepID=A0ABD5PVK3_9EURY|nr:hypothetical protein [Halosolutus amylolyticus]
METRWATVDGVSVEVPADCTCADLREAFRKPDDAVLIAVTGDLVSVVHDEETPLTELVAGCAETYYFWRDEEYTRTGILDVPELEAAVADDDAAESTFQRPGIDQ